MTIPFSASTAPYVAGPWPSAVIMSGSVVNVCRNSVK